MPKIASGLGALVAKWRLHNKLNVFFSASAFLIALTQPAKSDRFSEFILEMESQKQNSAVAYSSYSGSIGYSMGYATIASAKARSIEECKKWEAARLKSNCQVFWINGKYLSKINFDVKMPVILVFEDALTNKITEKNGFLEWNLREVPSSGSVQSFITVEGRKVCSIASTMKNGSILDLQPTCFNLPFPKQKFNQGSRTFTFKSNQGKIKITKNF